MLITLKPIKEQVIVIVGASSGIGRACALELSKRGAHVVVAARGVHALRTLVDEIHAHGGSALLVQADVTRIEDMHRLVASTLERYGRIDTWLHVAGVAMWARMEKTTPEEWRRIIDVNLNGQAHGVFAALPELRRHGGAFISISSVEAYVSPPYQGAYTASKHGVHGMLKTLRMELRDAKIPVQVTEILPSAIDTPIIDNSRAKIGVKPMPPPPLYHPSVVVRAVVHACEHPIDELIAGGVGWWGVHGQRLMPWAVEGFLRTFGFRLQHTDVPRSDDGPDNLFAPMPTPGSIRSSLHGRVLRHSVLTRVSMTLRSLSTWIRSTPRRLLPA